MSPSDIIWRKLPLKKSKFFLKSIYQGLDVVSIRHENIGECV